MDVLTAPLCDFCGRILNILLAPTVRVPTLRFFKVRVNSVFTHHLLVTAGGCCRDFRHAAPSAGNELEADVLDKLLNALSAGALLSVVAQLVQASLYYCSWPT